MFESHGTSGAWAQRVVDLTAYAGQRMQLRFYFETFDPMLNDYEGWYIDDVKVTWACTPDVDSSADFTGTSDRRASRRLLGRSLPIESHAGAGRQSPAGHWNFGTGAGVADCRTRAFIYALRQGRITVTLTA